MSLRKLLTGTLKTALCVAAIWWVARGIAFGELSQIWIAADKSLLGLGLLIFLLTPVLQGVRLRRLLAAQQIHIGVAESIRLAFAGNFMNFAAPIGSTSGDAYKAIYLSRRTDRSWEAATITLADRAVGLGTLLVSVTIIALLSGPGGRLAVLRGYLTLLSLGLVLGAVLVVALPAMKLPLIARWLERIPKRDVLLRGARATRALLTSPRVLALAILDTMGIQIAAAASFLCLALALGFHFEPRDWTALYAFFSTGEIVKALPGPPQGLGTMEVAYSYFFANWATAPQIVSAAIAIRFVNLACSLPGAAFVFGWQAPRQTAEAYLASRRSQTSGATDVVAAMES